MTTATVENIEREEQLVAFHLSDEVYGIDIAAIHEIIRLQEVTQVPRTSDDIEGIINLRGKIVPILNLRRRLGLTSNERTPKSRVIVVDVDQVTVGLEVDSVIGVLRLSENRIEQPNEMMGAIDADCVRGVGKTEDNLVILLNLKYVLRLGQE
jgi:purine-binding chemotaxis protein CheW